MWNYCFFVKSWREYIIVLCMLIFGKLENNLFKRMFIKSRFFVNAASLIWNKLPGSKKESANEVEFHDIDVTTRFLFCTRQWRHSLLDSYFILGSDQFLKRLWQVFQPELYKGVISGKSYLLLSHEPYRVIPQYCCLVQSVQAVEARAIIIKWYFQQDVKYFKSFAWRK